MSRSLLVPVVTAGSAWGPPFAHPSLGSALLTVSLPIAFPLLDVNVLRCRAFLAELMVACVAVFHTSFRLHLADWATKVLTAITETKTVTVNVAMAPRALITKLAVTHAAEIPTLRTFAAAHFLASKLILSSSEGAAEEELIVVATRLTHVMFAFAALLHQLLVVDTARHAVGIRTAAVFLAAARCFQGASPHSLHTTT